MGAVTLQEVAEHFLQLEEDPEFQGPLDVLLDLSACSSLPQRFQLAKIANRLKSLGGRERFLRCAIVTGRSAMYGMSRVFGVMAEGHFVAVRTFSAVAEAELWLALEPESDSPALPT
jgi:hypothetical protein